MKWNAAHAVESGPCEGRMEALSSTLANRDARSAIARLRERPSGTSRE